MSYRTCIKLIYSITLLLFCGYSLFAQTKVGGVLKDTEGNPIPFANVLFTDSNVGTITNDNGTFYLESDQTFTSLTVSYLGYKTRIIPLTSKVSLKIEITMEEEASDLGAVTITTGKTSKKNNPAIDILKKVWERRRKNGLYMFDQYEYKKYEKVEFDINPVDSALRKSRLFKNIEFVFDYADTSSLSGKTYLPIFINESIADVYGDNTINKVKEIEQANKNSGFEDNQNLTGFVKELYADIDVYTRHIKFFDKSFVSPIGPAGVDAYNYVLTDTLYYDGKRNFKIIFYPRRKNELTFKGDVLIADETFAVKEIKMQAVKSANINWVRDIYIEQEFDILNDSVYLISKEQFVSDFAITKRDEAYGLYGKRTTLFKDYEFNKPKEPSFYKKDVNRFDYEIYTRDQAYWDENRFEELTEEEKGIYSMLDTLKDTPKFKQIYGIGTILATGYIDMKNYDIGPIINFVGYNEVEGLRLNLGLRTYFSQNDMWRVEGFGAYGFRDNQFKYGINTKWMLDPKSRLIFNLGHKRDIEQLGAILTNTIDFINPNKASNSIITFGNNDRLSSVNLTAFGIAIEPLYNLELKLEGSYRTVKSANPDFNLDFWEDFTQTTQRNRLFQTALELTIDYTPKRKTSGYGVDRFVINFNEFAQYRLKYTRGFDGPINSDFSYNKLQFSYYQPILLGGFGRLFAQLEAGKTFEAVPLALLSPVPGNQTLTVLDGGFNTLDFYEFVTDEYVNLHLTHNFNGRLFSRIPWVRKFDLRELVVLKGAWGDISNSNRLLNASDLELVAPTDVFWEYGAGIGNIFKIMNIFVTRRGNYLSVPGAREWSVNIDIGFFF